MHREKIHLIIRLFTEAEIEKAFEECEHHLTEDGKYFPLNEFRKLKKRYYELQRRLRGGTIYNEHYDIENNKIAEAFLSFIRGLENTKRNSLMFIFGTLGLLGLIIAVYLTFFHSKTYCPEADSQYAIAAKDSFGLKVTLPGADTITGKSSDFNFDTTELMKIILLCDTAIYINENSYYGHYYRGYSRWILKQADKALEDLSIAIKICPTCAAYSIRRAIYMQMKEDLLAKKDARKIEKNCNEDHYNWQQ